MPNASWRMKMAIAASTMAVIVFAGWLVSLSERAQAEVRAKTEKESIAGGYQRGIVLLQEGKWEDASTALAAASLAGYKDAKVLRSYAEAQYAAMDNRIATAATELDSIPDDYSGDLHETVLTGKKQLMAKLTPLLQEERWKRAQLELVSFRWFRELDSFVRVVGEVKNVSDKPMESVEVTVSFYDKDNALMKTGSALVKYDPIMPGQTSPFEVIETYNPLMKTASVQFGHFMGERILTRDASDRKK